MKEEHFEKVVEGGWEIQDMITVIIFSIFDSITCVLTITTSPYFVFVAVFFTMIVCLGIGYISTHPRKIYWRKVK